MFVIIRLSDKPKGIWTMNAIRVVIHEGEPEAQSSLVSAPPDIAPLMIVESLY